MSWIWQRRRSSSSLSILLMAACSASFLSFSQIEVWNFKKDNLFTKLPCGSPGNERELSTHVDLTRLLKESSFNHSGLNLKGCPSPKRPNPICKQMAAWSDINGRLTHARELRDGESTSSEIRKRSRRFAILADPYLPFLQVGKSSTDFRSIKLFS